MADSATTSSAQNQPSYASSRSYFTKYGRSLCKSSTISPVSPWRSWPPLTIFTRSPFVGHPFIASRRDCTAANVVFRRLPLRLLQIELDDADGLVLRGANEAEANEIVRAGGEADAAGQQRQGEHRACVVREALHDGAVVDVDEVDGVGPR